MLLCLYRLLTSSLTSYLAYIFLKYRLIKGKEDESRLSERYGITHHPFKKDRSSWLIWIHAASVGESLSILSLVDALLKKNSHITIMVTSGTLTSSILLKKRLPLRAFHQFIPLDIGPWVRNFLDAWQPKLGLWVESELWPNLILEASKRKIPLIMINGRMSKKSFKRWQFGKNLLNRSYKSLIFV